MHWAQVERGHGKRSEWGPPEYARSSGCLTTLGRERGKKGGGGEGAAGTGRTGWKGKGS